MERFVMEQRQCICCRARFTPSRNPNQRYCAKSACQKKRRCKYQKQKLEQDVDYRANQRASEQNPFQRQPGINKTQIMGLAKLNFIERHENVVLIGKPGTGKSGIAMGLLRQALLNGYRGKFYNAQDMLNELYASLADRMTPRLLKKLFSYDVLVIDELGYLTLNTEQVNMFFKLIDMRYGKKPTIITTNLPFNAWYDVFKQKELVDALLDRFKHYCTVITIHGPSLRLPKVHQHSPSKKHLTAKHKVTKK